MKRISKTLLILVLCAWTCIGTNVVNASTSSRTAPPKRVEIQQHRHRPERPQHRSSVMNERDFQYLFKTIKRKSFEKDQLELLSVGVLDNYFSSRQCAKILSLFSFDKEKMKALDIMVEHIVDRENVHLILDSFRFDSDRQKAAKMLGVHRR